jgi:DNA-binding NarL/FixJ family response regulator
MEKLIKVAIVDDHELLRKGLLMQLEEIKNIKVISEFENGKEFVDSLFILDLDIVFMDINMPVMNGIEATREALIKKPELKIIALTRENDLESFQNMLEAGAVGFLLKNVSKGIIENAILSVMKGDHYYSVEMMGILTKNFIHPKKKEEKIKLSKREQETLILICKGMRNLEIGKKLFLSPRTIDGYRARIMSKIDVKNTASLILYAIKNKLVEIE